jgi:glucose/arabinose dehydrogenase
VRLQKLGDFDQPLYVTQPPGDRSDLFVVEQTGRVEVITPSGTSSTPFLDLHDQVSCCGEQGLLSIAFAPDYERSGLVYADYTDHAGDTRVVEFRRSKKDPLTVDPSSARVVLRVPQPFPNHNGGLLMFGPDGLLYIGLGDGGSEGDPDRNGQNLETLLGKILRIDPRQSGGRAYTVPSSNPFASRSGARPEIYAYGLRNPWRFSFDRSTGDLAIADVGQDAVEEVDFVRKDRGRGANFGWRPWEGRSRNFDEPAPGAIFPVITHQHSDGFCSITGGYVVRDRGVPGLYGRYVYGDFCESRIRAATLRAGHRTTGKVLSLPKVGALSSFGEDASGRVYATSLNGPVYRLAAR